MALVLSAEPGSSKLSEKNNVKKNVWKMPYSRIGSYIIIFISLQKVR